MAEFQFIFGFVLLMQLAIFGIDAGGCASVNGLSGCACKMIGSNQILSLQDLSLNSTFMDRRKLVYYPLFLFRRTSS